MNQNPFTGQAKVLKVSVTVTASSSAALPATGNVIRIVNEGTNTLFASIGTGSQTATVPATSSPVATCTPVLSGQDAVFSIPYTADTTQTPTPLNFSLITATGTATAYISVGEGV